MRYYVPNRKSANLAAEIKLLLKAGKTVDEIRLTTAASARTIYKYKTEFKREIDKKARGRIAPPDDGGQP